jgi:peptide/nickel transport system substrate-binding protein
MIKRRTLLAGGAAVATSMGGLASPSVAAPASVLKFVPRVNLSSPDPIWTTEITASVHGYMVWDTLYGIDASLTPQPQMVAGHEISSDNLTWRLTLRDGLFWHDGPPVRSADCIASIKRWGKRDGFGQKLMSLTNDIVAVDDKRFDFKLSKPFPLLPFALGANGCFIMPERIANTDAFQQIKEFVGSGPFKFLQNEWVSGSSVAYSRFDRYVPRNEPPSYWGGGKVAHFDRVEWTIMADSATSAAALQSGEVDWLEAPLIDLLPMLRMSPGVTLDVLDPMGALGMIVMNHILPPFDNPKIRQAVMMAASQDEFVQAVVGDQKELGRTGVGFFTLGSPYASTAGLEAIMGPRNLDLARQLVKDAGYSGEKVVVLSPSDLPQFETMALLTADLYKKIGLNVDYQSVDAGTQTARRASKSPIDKGGWSTFCTAYLGLQVANPGSSSPLRGNGDKAWFGWPNDPQMEALRDQWFEAPTLAAQQKITTDMQLLAFKDVPFVPVGQWQVPTAHRKDLTDFVKCGFMVFWGVRRV